MPSRWVAAAILATTIVLGGNGRAQAQARIGTPLATGEAPVAQQPEVHNPQAPKETSPVEFGLAPPTRDQVFRVQSEQALKQRLRQELPQVKKVDFPRGATLLGEESATAAQSFPVQAIAPIAGQVCYRPLYFEDKQTERFGNYVPCLQPFLSAGRFFGDYLLFPYRLCQAPPWTFECDNR